MTKSSYLAQQLPIVQRLLALAASAAITFSVFAGVVSLADDHPMAIAGQSTARTLAQSPRQSPVALAVAQAEPAVAGASDKR